MSRRIRVDLSEVDHVQHVLAFDVDLAQPCDVDLRHHAHDLLGSCPRDPEFLRDAALIDQPRELRG
jgi:hypothetical protein